MNELFARKMAGWMEPKIREGEEGSKSVEHVPCVEDIPRGELYDGAYT